MNASPALTPLAAPEETSLPAGAPLPAEVPLLDRMRSQPVWMVMLPLTLVAFLVGWIDYRSGWEMSLFIFYAAPIMLAVWWSGAIPGTALAVVCGFIWWFANQHGNPYNTQLGYTWAMVSRLFYFFIVVVAVTSVRRRQDADATRIRMLEDRRQLEADIVTVSDHEQQRIGQDLHDGLCQMLAAIGCATKILADDLKSKHLPEADDASLIEGSIQRTMLEARNLARGIFPVHVDREGLSTALSDLAKMTSQLTGTEITVSDPGDIEIDDPQDAMNLYRIAQEAVSNAVRHGEASRIRISLSAENGYLTLAIRDNGKGFPEQPTDHRKGMGLRVMQYRARCVGGSIRVDFPPEGGVLVTCHMPLNRCRHESSADR